MKYLEKFLREFLGKAKGALTGVAREKPAPVVTLPTRPTGIVTADVITFTSSVAPPRRCFNCTEELPEGFAWKYCEKCVLAVEEARIVYRKLARWEGL